MPRTTDGVATLLPSLARPLDLFSNASATENLALGSAHHGLQYRRFPKKKVRSYAKKFPTSLSDVMQVVRVLQRTPAHGKLFSGDIFWFTDGLNHRPEPVKHKA